MRTIRAKPHYKPQGQNQESVSREDLVNILSSVIRNYQPTVNSEHECKDKIIDISNHSFIERRGKFTNGIKQDLDPRDKEIIIPFHTIFNISSYQIETSKIVQASINSQQEKQKLMELKLKESTHLIHCQEYYRMRRDIYDYVSEVCQNVNSITFQLLNQGKLTQNEAKALAAKNILANIQTILTEIKRKFSESLEASIRLISEQLLLDLTRCVDNQLKELLSQLSSHYPQAPAAGETARMKQAIADVNRSQDQNNDLIFANKISIEEYVNGEDSQRFTGFIMKVINAAINTPNSPFSDQSDQTIFEKFHEFSERLFYVGQNHNINKNLNQTNLKQNIKKPKSVAQHKSEINEYFNQLFNPAQSSEIFSKFLEGKPQSLQQMRSQHKYGIAQKIPNYVKPFNDNAIQAGNFQNQNSSVLRIMTKWAEYLEEIFQKPQIHIMDRLYDFKKISNQLKIAGIFSKRKICGNLKKQYEQVKKQLKKMQERNTLFQSYILSQAETGTTYLKRFSEVRSASSQINTILIDFTRKYLCILIHHLIKAGNVGFQTINLVMFRVGDLLRSKIQCSESSFINILNILSLLDQSKEMEGKFKLVRIKNKLNQKDNNILINYMFMGKVQCQLQLSIQDMAKKDKNYYSFCHFLYELTRGKFGVLTECATIVSQHDPIVNSSKEMYYQAKRYQKIAEGKFQSHTIHKKNENIYKCWKCHQLKVRENVNLFKQQKNICNQCTIYGQKPQQKLNNNVLLGLQSYLLSHLSCKIQDYGKIENGKYVLSINNGRAGDTVKVFKVWQHKRQRKLFMIQINKDVLTNFGKQSFDYSSINYFNISFQKQYEETLKQLTFVFDKENLPQIFLLMKIKPQLIQRLDMFIGQFERFRLEKNIIKSIKIKSEIFELMGDPLKLQVFNEISEAFSENKKSKLRYKKCNVLEYNHIKKINLYSMKLKEGPHFLKHLVGCRKIDLHQNNITEISFQKQIILEKLQIYNNQINSIDLTKNINLAELDISINDLKNIDLTKNTNLTNLQLSSNKIRTIDLSKNISLTSFSLSQSQLEEIDLSNNINLKQLDLSCTKLTNVDLSSNPNIAQLYLSNNNLSKATFWYSPELSVCQLQNSQSASCHITLLHRKGEAQKCKRYGNELIQKMNKLDRAESGKYEMVEHD